ncbi:MAG: hypothetical protein Q8S00_32640 [Deltaproteobacteria bacterium]|nr:hypothetical protein [Deltaproteobacteria bacterium]
MAYCNDGTSPTRYPGAVAASDLGALSYAGAGTALTSRPKVAPTTSTLTRTSSPPPEGRTRTTTVTASGDPAARAKIERARRAMEAREAARARGRTSTKVVTAGRQPITKQERNKERAEAAEKAAADAAAAAKELAAAEAEAAVAKQEQDARIAAPTLAVSSSPWDPQPRSATVSAPLAPIDLPANSGSKLFLPLAIGGGALVLFLLLKKR